MLETAKLQLFLTFVLIYSILYHSNIYIFNILCDYYYYSIKGRGREAYTSCFGQLMSRLLLQYFKTLVHSKRPLMSYSFNVLSIVVESCIAF